MTKKRNIKPGEIIGTGEGVVNQNSQDFKALQKAIRARSEEWEDLPIGALVGEVIECL